MPRRFRCRRMALRRSFSSCDTVSSIASRALVAYSRNRIADLVEGNAIRSAPRRARAPTSPRAARRCPAAAPRHRAAPRRASARGVRLRPARSRQRDRRRRRRAPSTAAVEQVVLARHPRSPRRGRLMRGSARPNVDPLSLPSVISSAASIAASRSLSLIVVEHFELRDRSSSLDLVIEIAVLVVPLRVARHPRETQRRPHALRAPSTPSRRTRPPPPPARRAAARPNSFSRRSDESITSAQPSFADEQRLSDRLHVRANRRRDVVDVVGDRSRVLHHRIDVSVDVIEHVARTSRSRLPEIPRPPERG